MINLVKREKYQKMPKTYLTKNNLSEVIKKFVNKCKDNDLINYFAE